MGRKKGRRWNSCLIWFLTSLGAFCLLTSTIQASDESGDHRDHVISDDTNSASETVCTEKEAVTPNERKLVLVSTLDGKLSALEVGDEGKLAWSIEADSNPLLSSSISKLEISHDGVPTRYIPSLDGGLYKYDGDSIEAVPMTADSLLSASFKLADNTVMVGGKDLHTYGLDPHTGKVMYTCGVSGCDSAKKDVTKQEDVLVLTRQTQTVRAVDSRAGAEKWNFSVGQHDVKFIKGQRQVITEDPNVEGDEESTVHTCPADGEDTLDNMETFSSSIKIVVPEGMVVGVDTETLQLVRWQYKFKSPISSVWLLYKGDLVRLNMFGNTNIPALSSFEPEEQPLSTPLLYVGMHQNQLYVQPCTKLKEKVSELADRHRNSKVPSKFANIPRVAWKPYLNTAQWRTPAINTKRPQITGKEDPNCPAEEQQHGLTIWHENYPFDNGFYLYPEFTLQVPLASEEGDDPTDESNASESMDTMFGEFIPIPVSLWNWWKEVIAISIITSVLVHLILTRVQRRHQLQIAESSTSLTGSGSGASIQDPEIQQAGDINLASRQNSDEAKTEYVSRFEADFDMIEVLGKGGFGVVFETKNKVDECHYAVKRIALPNSEGAKEKVMREVKALAKLDHVGIVRYFHAWIESPPLGWQEEKDRELEASELPSTITADGFTTKSVYTKHSPGSSPPKSHSIDPAGDCPKPMNNSPKPKPSPLDFLQNPFGGNMMDLSDSVIKRGSSEEFSVNNKGDSFWGKSDDGDITEEEDESGSFSCGLGTPNLGGFTVDNSVDIEFRLSDKDDSVSREGSVDNNDSYSTSSPKSIPFSRYDRSSNNGSLGNRRISENNDSLQIVFEDSGCAENKSSKESSSDVCIGILSSQSEDRLSSSLSKPHTKSHSRTPSKDLAKITIEKEGKNSAHKLPHGNGVSKKSHETKPKLYLYIQMQLCKRETLKDWLSSNTLNRDRHMVLDMFDQITSAIEYVHDCGLMHRDLKPSNIFFSLDGVIKMGDFGLVQTAFPNEPPEEIYSMGNPYKKHTAQVGTTLYMSPEQMSGKVYSQKVDIFSLGLILFEMLYPFATNMERVDTLSKVKQQNFPGRFCREMEHEYKLVKDLVSSSPDQRPTAKNILSWEMLKEFENRRMPRRFRSRTTSQNSN